MNRDDLIPLLLLAAFLVAFLAAAWLFNKSHNERETLYGSDED